MCNSVEKLRQRFESGDTLHSDRGRDMSVVTIGDGSTFKSNGRSLTHDSILDRSKQNSGSTDRESYPPYLQPFNSDDRLYGNCRFADRDVYDNTITPSVNGVNDVSLLDGRRLFSSTHHEGMNGLDASHAPEGVSMLETSVQLAELDTLRSKCNAMEELNKTLKDELNMYENLCKSEGIQTSPMKADDKRRETCTDYEMIRANLSEFRALRMKLEKQIDYNKGLYQSLDRNRETDSRF